MWRRIRPGSEPRRGRRPVAGDLGSPYDVVEAVAYHHQPSLIQSTEFDLLTAVHIANALTHDIASSTESEAQLDLAHLESLGLIGDIPPGGSKRHSPWEP